MDRYRGRSSSNMRMNSSGGLDGASRRSIHPSDWRPAGDGSTRSIPLSFNSASIKAAISSSGKSVFSAESEEIFLFLFGQDSVRQWQSEILVKFDRRLLVACQLASSSSIAWRRSGSSSSTRASVR